YAETLETRGREDQPVDLSVIELAQPRVHVPPDVDEARARVRAQPLSRPTDARGPDRSAVGQLRVARDEDVERVRAERNRSDDDALVVARREVLRGMHGEVHLPGLERADDLRDEQSLHPC